MAKTEFLRNFRTARNLFVHGPIRAGSIGGLAAAANQQFARTAVWFTPKSVGEFDASDFSELSDQNRAILKTAVEDFLRAVNKAPPGSIPTQEQLEEAIPPFEKLISILEPFLFYPDEAAAVEHGLGNLLPLPDWMVNWDFELKPDSDDVPAVYLTVYVDETHAPLQELGKEASILTSKLRRILNSHGLKRSPYVRFQSVAQHTAA